MGDRQELLWLTVQGTIETCSTSKTTTAYVRYAIYAGASWEIHTGTRQGISPLSRLDGNDPAVLNHPLRVTLKATAPFGWPVIVVAAYGHDQFGNDRLVGYGSCHVPAINGSKNVTVPLFQPRPLWGERLKGFFTGLYPELQQLGDVAKSGARESLCTQSEGSVLLKLNVVFNDPDSFQLIL